MKVIAGRTVLEAFVKEALKKTEKWMFSQNICGDVQELKGHLGQYLYPSLSFLIPWRLLDCFVLYVF